jgi:hypothetical protein
MLEPLRAARVLIPAATVLERIGLIARVTRPKTCIRGSDGRLDRCRPREA